MHHARPSASIRRFPIDGGLLLLDTSSGRLFAFNDAARHVWDLLAAGRFDEALVNDFAAWWGIPPSRAQTDVLSILTQWRELGLLDGYEPAAAPSRCISFADGDHTPEPEWASEWTCTIRGKAIQFAVGNGVAPTIFPLFKHLETPGVRPQTRIEIRAASGNEMLLVEDGIERIRTSDAGELAGAVQQTVLERIYPGVVWLALIHGAAVARNNEGIGLAGPSGSGKSTLTAGLLSAGFDYLADDMIALSAPCGAIVPWPLPLSIKPGSMEVIVARHPELSQAPRYHTKGLEASLLIPPGSVWDSEHVKLRAMVFPRFVAGATADLQPISSFDTVARLLNDRIWLGHPVTEERVTAFLEWLNDTASYAIAYGELEDGVRLVESILA
jgi:Coenzyme PQQ synthesis protein D (PqqD)